ncbi:hypothetical protein evm_013882 [Chilo suppressalis]|nr:hypothetical protein evm_013882 [Chilo suppressalis]
MMDAWNLAICLGPTLLAAWGEGGAQVTARTRQELREAVHPAPSLPFPRTSAPYAATPDANLRQRSSAREAGHPAPSLPLPPGHRAPYAVHQANLVNELVKRVILHHHSLFPQDIAPHTLYTRQFPSAEESDEPDSRDDLSLYDDDDDDISEDGESGEWQDSNSTENRSTGAGSGSGPGSGPGPGQAAGPAGVAAHDLQEPAEPAPAAAPQADLPPVSTPHCSRRLAESTPDLVLDLPARAATGPGPAPDPDPALAPESDPASDPAPDPTPSPAPVTADAASDSADTFLHNRDTLKKRPASRRTPGPEDAKPEGDSIAASDGDATAAPHEAGSGSETGSEAGSDTGTGSPVPARNTARVAAKFADLTLTGGSLKPALAAKPALLRRPTPHPRAAPPAPPTPARSDPPC